jgi:hypothetical protein
LRHDGGLEGWFEMRLLALLPAVLPVATVAAAWYALRPVEPVRGPLRLAAVRAALVVGAYAELSIEVLSATGFLTRFAISVVWVLGLAAATTGAVVRNRRDAALQRAKRARITPVEWLSIVGLLAVGCGTLVVALAAEPNTWDSQAYHLPKVEQWVATGSVGLYPTPFFSQAALAPGAEYLLLHLRLLTGVDALYNMVQWSAGLLCALAASWIAAQLGAGRLGQLTTALVVATAPMVVVQASSTQTDLVVAAWCGSAAVLVVDSAWRRFDVANVLLLGLAVGLVAATKATGLMAVGPLLVLWFAVRAWRARSMRAASELVGAALVVGVVVLLITGPFLIRIDNAYGNPIGPPVVREHAMERHDLPAVTVNAARLLQTVTMVPWDPVNDVTAGAVKRLASMLGVGPADPATTLAYPFPLPHYTGPDEDVASFPIQVLAACCGLIFCLLRGRRDLRALGYALSCLAMGVGFAATLKYQWFGNRFLLAGLVVAAPMAGLVADALVRRARPAARTAAAAGLSLVVIGASVGGVHAVLFGAPRPLYGHSSVLTAAPMAARFARAPMYQPDYEWAADLVKSAGAQRIGMVENGTWFEYPWWVLLRGRQLVNLESDVPGHPGPPPTTVDAIICYVPPPDNCAARVPPGWTLQTHTYVAVALPNPS